MVFPTILAAGKSTEAYFLQILRSLIFFVETGIVVRIIYKATKMIGDGETLSSVLREVKKYIIVGICIVAVQSLLSQTIKLYYQ